MSRRSLGNFDTSRVKSILMPAGSARRFVASLVLISMFSLESVAHAQMQSNLFQREKENLHSISEYIAGDEVKEKLMPVYLLGAVAKPGLYHIPLKSDLKTLLAISGGPSHEADTTGILIRNEDSRRLETVDFEKAVASIDLRSPSLNQRDVIWVPTKEPVISNNTLLIITVVSSVLTAALTAVVLNREFSK